MNMLTTISYFNNQKACIQKVLLLLIASLAANIVWAQDVCLLYTSDAADE